jgi:hypothetical protein
MAEQAAEAEAPVVLSLRVAQLRDNLGSALAEVDTGAILLVRNAKDGRGYWVCSEAEVPRRVQAYLDHLPGPETADHLGPETADHLGSEPELSPWTVRAEPEPQAAGA